MILPLLLLSDIILPQPDLQMVSYLETERSLIEVESLVYESPNDPLLGAPNGGKAFVYRLTVVESDAELWDFDIYLGEENRPDVTVAYFGDFLGDMIWADYNSPEITEYFPSTNLMTWDWSQGYGLGKGQTATLIVFTEATGVQQTVAVGYFSPFDGVPGVGAVEVFAPMMGLIPTPTTLCLVGLVVLSGNRRRKL